MVFQQAGLMAMFPCVVLVAGQLNYKLDSEQAIHLVVYCFLYYLTGCLVYEEH